MEHFNSGILKITGKNNVLESNRRYFCFTKLGAGFPKVYFPIMCNCTLSAGENTEFTALLSGGLAAV